MDNLKGYRQRPHLSQSPTPGRSGSVREALPRSQPEGSQDTRGLCRSRVERSCPQQPNVNRVQSPYAVSYSPSYNSKQRQTFSAQYSLASKPCNFKAFSDGDSRENGLPHQKSGRNSCLRHWADYAHLNIICKNKEKCYDNKNAKSWYLPNPYRSVGQDRPAQPSRQFPNQGALL